MPEPLLHQASSLLERALEHAVNGDAEAGLKYAAQCWEKDPTRAISIFVVAWILGQLGEQTELANQLFAQASAYALSQGNAPLAIAAAKFVTEPAGSDSALLDKIAQSFAKGSPLLGPHTPPSLPRPRSDAEITQISRAEALSKIQATAQQLKAADIPQELSPHSLFSALDAGSLRQLLELLEVRLLPRHAVLIEEGVEGDFGYVVVRGEFEVQKRQNRDSSEKLFLARVGAGSVVGEMALLSRAPRAASVVAKEPAIVLSAAKDALDRIAESAPALGHKLAEFCRRRMLENLVRTSLVFHNVSPKERASLVERFQVRLFEPKQKLIEQGARASGLYVVALGEVTVVREDAGEATVVARLGPGEVVGEVALVLRRPAIAHVVAHHPSFTLFLPADQFLGWAKSHPHVFVDLYELAVRRDEETKTIADSETTDTEDFVLV